MKIRNIDKTSKRTARVFYEENQPEVFDYVVFVNPQNGHLTWDYTSMGANIPFDVPTGCTKNANTPNNLKRYCFILNTLKECGIKYEYYTGHQNSYQEVLKNGVANCCDLARLINKLATDTFTCTNCGTTLTQTKFILANIKVNDATYQHLFNYMYVDNKWLILDGVNYLLNGVANDVMGEFLGALSIISGTDGSPCD